MQVGCGIGLLMGPTLGSFIYGFVGYMYSFVTFGVIILISIIPMLILIPADSTAEEKETKARL
jgi:predicted MFS family arabinose efflux permease